MFPSLAASLAAIQSLATPHPPVAPVPAIGRDCLLTGTPPPAVLVIQRPEASDLFIPRKARTTAASILAHNPSLLRARTDRSAYQLDRATDLAWRTLRHSDLPAARALSSLQTAVVPEPGSATLLAFTSLFLLRRRRVQPSPSP